MNQCNLTHAVNPCRTLKLTIVLEKSTVDSCNNSDKVIEMTATLRNVAGEYGQDNDGVITFARNELTPKFSGNLLIMEKVLGGGDCTRTSVDGVEVCTTVAETVTRCSS